MPRSPLFHRAIESLHIAQWCERHRISAADGVADRHQRRIARQSALGTRRDFLSTLGMAGAAAAFLPKNLHAAKRPAMDVGIVGAGLAGLACADSLAASGVVARVYEARDRLGGRQWSMGGDFPGPVQFPGQVVERGGELIDNLHKTMLGYARRFGLIKEDVHKTWLPGETFFHVDGHRVSETVVVDEFRDFVSAMRRDLTRLSNEVTASSHSAYDAELDHLSLAEYLESRGAAPNLRAILDIAYTIEYGLETSELSALNLLFFIHADRRSRFQPFGVFSDERYHLVDGNEQIAALLAAGLPGPIEMGMILTAVRRTPAGRIELTFSRGSQTVTRTHDAVVLTLPFSVLRHVDLDISLALPASKLRAIADLRYGTNAKLNVGFDGRFWGALGGNGETYSDLPHHQSTWEPNPSRATDRHAVLLDYSGGRRGADLNPADVQGETERWLANLELLYPGATGAATRLPDGRRRAHLQHWPTDPFSLGSYTANHPGYFTTIAGFEAMPVGNLFFAGEHTDSFYEWQGFMEGAANSGIRAASEVLETAR